MAYSIPRSHNLRRLQSWSAAWSDRRRRVPTVLAPALPALILLAVTTAGMVDPPQNGLVTQLHLAKTVTAVDAPIATSGHDADVWNVTPR